jgi:hypothetical protein
MRLQIQVPMVYFWVLVFFLFLIIREKAEVFCSVNMSKFGGIGNCWTAQIIYFLHSSIEGN